jgi:hypothetical protein
MVGHLLKVPIQLVVWHKHMVDSKVTAIISCFFLVLQDELRAQFSYW